jgi:hypothetical protein
MLPSIMGTAAATAPQTAPEDALSEARAIAESITGKNWREKKAALLALVG